MKDLITSDCLAFSTCLISDNKFVNPVLRLLLTVFFLDDISNIIVYLSLTVS